MPGRNLRCLAAVLSLLAGFAVSGVPRAAGAQAAGKELQRSGQGVATLQQWYDPATGLYRSTGWWNSANALTVLVDYARLARSAEYNFLIANTFVAAQNQHVHFLNEYYDDEGWWALAWIDAYDLTGNKQYLSMAEMIFTDMAGGWDETCGGGIWWNKQRHYKNAIANELFLSVAAHLANRDSTHRDQYLDWANREWKWFASSGMINSENLVNDGLKIPKEQPNSGACVNNGQTTWSYNQGVVLGGLAELSKAGANTTLLDAAGKIAGAAITHLADREGVLHDRCEPKCGADGVQFKGIFVRNLAALYDASPQPDYKSFVEKNASAIWRHDRGMGHHFGLIWSGPFHDGNAAVQSSALDALIAAAALDSKSR